MVPPLLLAISQRTTFALASAGIEAGSRALCVFGNATRSGDARPGMHAGDARRGCTGAAGGKRTSDALGPNCAWTRSDNSRATGIEPVSPGARRLVVGPTGACGGACRETRRVGAHVPKARPQLLTTARSFALRSALRQCAGACRQQRRRAGRRRGRRPARGFRCWAPAHAAAPNGAPQRARCDLPGMR